MSEIHTEYRNWLIQYDADSYIATPIPACDWGEMDWEGHELSSSVGWRSADDALRHAQSQIDQWWDAHGA